MADTKPTQDADYVAAKKADEAPRCDHICRLDEGHVERGEVHQYGYEIPSPRRPAGSVTEGATSEPPVTAGEAPDPAGDTERPRLSWWRRLRLYIWHQGFSFWWPPQQDMRAERNVPEHAPEWCGCEADILCLCPCQECRDYNTDPDDEPDLIDGSPDGLDGAGTLEP